MDDKQRYNWDDFGYILRHQNYEAGYNIPKMPMKEHDYNRSPLTNTTIYDIIDDNGIPEEYLK